MTDLFWGEKIESGDVNETLRGMCKIILEHYAKIDRTDNLIEHFFYFNDDSQMYILKHQYQIKRDWFPTVFR